MAGKLIVDTIDTDNAFITLNVQQSLIATMNVSGIYSNTGVKMIGANGTVSNTAITGNIISSQITSVANTQITGNIISSQITSNPTLYGNVSVTGVIGVGGATPSTSGAGISFPATQSASSDANTLDDYEEGTWTPAIAGGTTAGTYTYEAARTGGRYTKVGNLVTVWGVVRINAITSAGTGTLLITGLPFTSGSAIAPSWSNSDAIMVNMYAAGVNASATSYPPPIMGVLSSGVTFLEFASFGKNYQIQTVIGSLSAASWIYQITGCYTTA